MADLTAAGSLLFPQQAKLDVEHFKVEYVAGGR